MPRSSALALRFRHFGWVDRVSVRPQHPHVPSPASIANSDFEARADIDSAIEAGWRAVTEQTR